jgi:hypothetical protein
MNETPGADVTLKLNAPLAAPAPAGAKLTFEGNGDSFSKSPFALVITAGTAQIVK